MTFGALISAVLLGFITGLLSFKVKQRWCPECGASTLREVPADVRRPRNSTPSAAGAFARQHDDRER